MHTRISVCHISFNLISFENLLGPSYALSRIILCLFVSLDPPANDSLPAESRLAEEPPNLVENDFKVPWLEVSPS